jgi:hypothetical protein
MYIYICVYVYACTFIYTYMYIPRHTQMNFVRACPLPITCWAKTTKEHDEIWSYFCLWILAPGIELGVPTS